MSTSLAPPSYTASIGRQFAMPVPAAAIAVPAITAGVQALLSFFGNRSANKAAGKAAQLQYTAAIRAMQLQDEAARRQETFLREQEATRRKEWEETQRRNREMYDLEMARDEGRYQEGLARRRPFVQFGVGSIGQLARPLPGRGSLGSRMGA